MSKVVLELSMSLDGYVAGPNDRPGNGMGDGGMRLFQWYSSGDTDLVLPGTDMVFKVSRASAEFLREPWSTIGASVIGRRTFDIAGGWGGNPPGGQEAAHFVVTHTIPHEWTDDGSPFIFVTDGVESAVRKAQQVAGEKNVDIVGAKIAQQCLEARLLDEIQIDLAPVLLGGGIRLFENLGDQPIELELIQIVKGTGVTHFRYRVVK